ncbi:unnamed protein product [Pocillopora meandrina]|uniref:Uncharacterized protein n=1 Tax=Pocillopora meandrina TaxID=46732 RepID=A0AAU9Y5Q5_9CNID|nr:unnamed protein product [Pocillopora meandrina]
MENVSRDRCCAPPSSGGLNVVNFKAKCASLRLSVFSNNFRTLHQKTGALPDSLTGKNLYLLLLDPVCVAPRCSGFWASAMDRPINRWAWVWRKSRLKAN